MVLFKVGSKSFEVTRSALESHPDSMLSILCASDSKWGDGRGDTFELDNVSEDMFTFVGRYLHGEHAFIAELSTEQRSALRETADYLQLSGLHDELRPRLVGSFASPEEERLLLTWVAEALDVPVGNLEVSLLYDSKLHGEAVQTFHELCDARGPTLTIGITGCGCLLGGFATDSWQSNETKCYRHDPESLICSMRDGEVFKAVATPHMYGSSALCPCNRQVFSRFDCFPCFGEGFDICFGKGGFDNAYVQRASAGAFRRTVGEHIDQEVNFKKRLRFARVMVFSCKDPYDSD